MARVTRKVNLRNVYKMGGYTGDYARFVREKVVPIIGEAALHPLPSKRGSRVREYAVTKRNLTRVATALGIETTRQKRVRAVRTAISDISPQATAEVIVQLIEGTTQPTACTEYPISYRIPIHPISHNMLYKAVRSRFVKSDAYTKFRRSFFPLIQGIVPKESGVDFTKPLEVLFKFGHRERSDRGGTFDRANFQKAAQDCIFEHFGYDDSKVLKSSVEGEFVNSYDEGFIEFKIRNI